LVAITGCLKFCSTILCCCGDKFVVALDTEPVGDVVSILGAAFASDWNTIFLFEEMAVLPVTKGEL